MLLALQRLVSPPRPDLRILPRLIDKLDAVSLDDRPTSGQRGDSRSRRQSRFRGAPPSRISARSVIPLQLADLARSPIVFMPRPLCPSKSNISKWRAASSTTRSSTGTRATSSKRAIQLLAVPANQRRSFVSMFHQTPASPAWTTGTAHRAAPSLRRSTTIGARGRHQRQSKRRAHNLT